MARRRMHRETRRFLLVFSLVAGGLLVFAGSRFFFGSEPATALTSQTAAHKPEGMAVDPGLRPLVPANASETASGNPYRTSAEAESATPVPDGSAGDAPGQSLVKFDPAGKRPLPPTTQPTGLGELTTTEAQKAMEAGFAARDANDLIAARNSLNKALHGGLSPSDEAKVRQALAQLADETIFSRTRILENDPLVERYIVKRGDRLAHIARRHDISTAFLASLNNIADPDHIRLGASMKVVHGPFNACVAKNHHLMHVYLQDVYVKTFRVALGTNGGTPTGVWKVINHLENPDWIDPEGKRWHANDPNNPLGEFWIGLDGIEGEAVGRTGFGIHGTIEPETIGQDVSLGCVRLVADDIALLYKLLVPGESIVTIVEK